MYESPSITEVGAVRDVTLAINLTGNQDDKYPGLPFGGPDPSQGS